MTRMSRRPPRQPRSRKPWLALLAILVASGYMLTRSDGIKLVEAFGPTAAPSAEPVRVHPARPEAATAPANPWAGKFTFAGEPRPTGYPHPLERLVNLAYLVAYDEVRCNPAWSAYRIPAHALKGTPPRPAGFQIDERTTDRISPDTYTNTGFDRGHLTPNFAVASRFGTEAQKETFLMSNVVPQKPALNQGPWRRLEDVLANTTAVHDGEIWVVIGPVYAAGDEIRLRQGPVIPSAFFAVIADETAAGPRLQAFIIPQWVERNSNFRNYLTTVDDVQKKTGLDFFWELPDSVEIPLEAKTGPYWLEN